MNPVGVTPVVEIGVSHSRVMDVVVCATLLTPVTGGELVDCAKPPWWSLSPVSLHALTMKLYRRPGCRSVTRVSLAVEPLPS